MVKNPWGSDHAEAINSANHSIKEKIEKIELPPGVTPVTMPNQVRDQSLDTDQSNSSIHDEDDISDNETGSQMINSPTVTFSCDAALIAPGVAINGTLSIHQEEIYWEADDSGTVIKKFVIRQIRTWDLSIRTKKFVFCQIRTSDLRTQREISKKDIINNHKKIQNLKI